MRNALSMLTILTVILLSLIISCASPDGAKQNSGSPNDSDCVAEYSVSYAPLNPAQIEAAPDFYDPLNHPFPRLAMWWPSSWEQSVIDLARYDWIGWGPWDDMNALKRIKDRNPNQLHFMSGTITETVWQHWRDSYSQTLMAQIPGEWFLTEQGSVLAEPIDSTQTVISVQAMTNRNGEPLFEAGDTLVCGYESMLVLEVRQNSKELIVERSFYRDARPHSAGTRIAAHITFWPETWVMNLSESCPAVSVNGEEYRWSEWAVEVYLEQIYPGGMDGYILDRLEADQSWLIDSFCSSISPDYSNRLVHDYSDFDAAWLSGIRKALKRFREVIPEGYLLANSFGAHADLLDGAIYEGLPTNWDDDRPVSYSEWAGEEIPFALGDEGYLAVSTASNPNFSFAETYEVSQWYSEEELAAIIARPPDEQNMRYGLTTALLGNGYFSYEVSTQGHGRLRLYWFDEYDDGGHGRGYLGYPLQKAQILLDAGDDGVAYVREFEHGLVLCNPSNVCIDVDPGPGWRSLHRRDRDSISQDTDLLHLEPQDGAILVRDI